jgi:hypothetical protein
VAGPELADVGDGALEQADALGVRAALAVDDAEEPQRVRRGQGVRRQIEPALARLQRGSGLVPLGVDQARPGGGEGLQPAIADGLPDGADAGQGFDAAFAPAGRSSRIAGRKGTVPPFRVLGYPVDDRQDRGRRSGTRPGPARRSREPAGGAADAPPARLGGSPARRGMT